MNLYRVLSVIVAAALGCTSAPPPAPPPVNPHVSAIAVSAKIHPAGLLRVLQPTHAAAQFYFIRVDDPVAEGLLIRSNYSHGPYVYLLNAAPGRYAAVAAGYSAGGNPGTMGSGYYDVEAGGWQQTPGTPSSPDQAFTVYLPQALIEETAVTVGTGGIAFMGEMVLEEVGAIFHEGQADEAQRRYHGLLAPGDSETWSLLRHLSDEKHRVAHRRGYDRGEAARARFLAHSREGFAGTGWESRFLRAVGSGPAEEPEPNPGSRLPDSPRPSQP